MAKDWFRTAAIATGPTYWTARTNSASATITTTILTRGREQKRYPLLENLPRLELGTVDQVNAVDLAQWTARNGWILCNGHL